MMVVYRNIVYASGLDEEIHSVTRCNQKGDIT